MTLLLKEAQLQKLQDASWPRWVRLHRELLADLLPEIAASHSGEGFTQRVEILLRRADLHGMEHQSETVPYCYASLTLGIGFEARATWAATAMALRGDARGRAIWDGLEASCGVEAS